MHLKRNGFGYRPALRALLGSLLAVVLFVSVTFSASHAFHRFIHQDSPDQGHLCLVCSIVKGQLTATEAVAVAALFLWAWAARSALAPIEPALHFAYLLLPSRAPPSR